MPSSSRLRRLIVAATTTTILVIPVAAFAHAEITPAEADPSTSVTFTITSIVERPEANGINARMRTLVPRGFAVTACTLPATWSCTIDPETYAPDTLLVWEPLVAATPSDVNFSFTATTPAAAGTYLLRTLQEHFDGFTEPWAYEAEPYPAPRVTVGGDPTVVNGDGGPQDPACFGPDEQPTGYDSHDGAAGDEGCTIPASTDPEPAPTASPSSAPTASPAPAPSPTTDGQALPATGADGLVLFSTALVLTALGVLTLRREAPGARL